MKETLKDDYLKFLEVKFGRHIMDKLFDEENFCLKKEECYPSSKLLQCKNKVKIKELSQCVLELNEHIDKEWAFDFPGWVGMLNFTNDNVKEIMVIGLEPHIEKYECQVIYGLHETGDNEYRYLERNKRNEKLWKNLSLIMSPKEGEEDKCYQELLSRVYVTDLCHFGLKGATSKTINLKNWKSIRMKIAKKFISKEIEFIKPKYIVSQGRVVADFIDNEFFGKQEKLSVENFEEIKFGRYKNIPRAFKYQCQDKREVYHLKLPHIGSGHTSDFWKCKETLRKLRDRLHDFEKKS